MAGYSATPLARKLGIKPTSRLLVLDAPAEWDAWVAPLPDGVIPVSPDTGPADVIVCFTTRASALTERFANLRERLRPTGGLWVAWPKKASGMTTDLSGDVVRSVGLAHGLVDNKVCAISEVWSGLRFVVRVADRPRASKTVRKGP